MINLAEAADSQREVAWDCRFFLGDRPWTLAQAQRRGVHLRSLSADRERLLIIKLDAMGDVLRTISLLPAMADAHPRAVVTDAAKK